MPLPRSPGLRLDAFMHQALEPVFWLGPERRILLVNRAWEELTGHAADEVLGLECNPHGPTRAGDLIGLGGSFCPPPEALSGQPSVSKTLIIHAGGERRWRRIEFWPFHETKGSLVGILGLIRASDAPTLAVDSEGLRLRSELLELRDRLMNRHGLETLIGRGAEHRRLLDQIATASLASAPVLIVGETGSGKKLVARSIHQKSQHRSSSMISFDCKALPPEMLERELFGTSQDRFDGSLAAQEGSTVLISEIIDLPRDLQARLASGLDGRVRLIATTTSDPETAFRTERLRSDLYYALTTMILRLRPLRERLDELSILAQHLLERANLRGNRQRDGFTPQALEALASYDWPGNLQELSRVVEQAHDRGRLRLIQLEDIPPEIRGHRGGAYQPPASSGPSSMKEILTLVERRLIENALDRSGQNKSKAAKLLGISRPLLYRRIKELEIPNDPDSSEELPGGLDCPT